MSTLALRGSSWVTVRQYRRTLWTAGALVLLSLAVIGGLRLWDGQTPDRYVQDGSRFPADENRGYEMLRLATEYAGQAMLLLPLLVGAFVAGPLVAREYESGTYRLGLTQSIGPAAWLRAKLLTTGVAALAVTLALMGVFHLAWNRVSGTYPSGWSDRGPYEASGVVLLGHVLAAVAVGALVGQLVRRTLPAMAATGVVTGVVLLGLGALRWSFLAPRTVTGPVGRSLMLPEGAHVTGSWLLTATGERFEESVCWEEATTTSGMGDDPNAWGKWHDLCLTRHGVTSRYAEYHPDSHFWPTQLVETGIVLALAALALFAAFRVLRARHP
ncbi:ABC transporter permease [Streptomyces sp. NPDC101158]|uniref:ABC transporter permease n=1 Tax=Streptomyces sp. NPDC101158 TaxID=3366117 RepID=UPI0037FFD92F